MCSLTISKTRRQAAFSAALAMAVSAPAMAIDLGGDWKPVNARRLAETRGGFVTPSGLILSLGIERSVSINGNMVAQTSVHISDVRALTSVDAAALKNAMQPMLVQQGHNSALPSTVYQLPTGTFVQNGLNYQSIATSTVISTTLNSGSLLKEINFMSSVRDAAIGSLSLRN